MYMLVRSVSLGVVLLPDIYFMSSCGVVLLFCVPLELVLVSIIVIICSLPVYVSDYVVCFVFDYVSECVLLC